MSACEKCWSDANARAFMLGGNVVDHYHDLLDERRDAPCSAAEQRGDVEDTRHFVGHESELPLKPR